MKFLKEISSIPTNDEDLLESVNNLTTYKFNFINLLIKISISIIYAFGLGYSLFYCNGKIISTFIRFLMLFLLTYYLIKVLHEFIHALTLPKIFSNNVNLLFNFKTLSVNVYSNSSVSKYRIIFFLLIPIIILTFIPTILSYLLGFNIYLYVLASVNAILSSKDILNLILVIKNINNDYNILIKPNKLYYNKNTGKE
ncbi:metalloprotease family protein [Clostridium septicum]|uniref:Metalloprotease family protein n=1 Tax=Clostridium septicum TaxID=1504 RepID=A0A9N7JJC7_CLOSE|nr:metalloprotease family protein [Clostridium septicum]AYE32976.1 hypothetical protein CP523_00170 [Clostridium septicum]MDU1314189.1 metalloprotease family protein [Clostridium septicum]QAS61156.1 hypothetical protein EI377_10725 [Clostridium septicum]UEC19509.1 metalloprotease family protein [Clostridium septicum]USR99538.1 metalloprotease family protein [Clostridium septicum]